MDGCCTGEPSQFLINLSERGHHELVNFSSAVCLDLARLIERDAHSVPKKKGDLQPMLEEAYHNMYAEGPGCFSWADENKVREGSGSLTWEITSKECREYGLAICKPYWRVSYRQANEEAADVEVEDFARRIAHLRS